MTPFCHGLVLSNMCRNLFAYAPITLNAARVPPKEHKLSCGSGSPSSKGFDSQQKTFHDTVPLGPKNALRNSAVIKGLCYEIDFQNFDKKPTSFGYK